MPIPRNLDGIARHHAETEAAARKIGTAPTESMVKRAVRLAAVFGPGVSASDAFHRSPAYRAQLAELSRIALAARDTVAL